MKTRSTRLCLSNSKACTLRVWILLGHTREMGKETTWFYITGISYSSEETLVLAKSKCQRQAWHFQDVLKVPKRSNSNSMLADFFSPSVEKAIAAPAVIFFFFPFLSCSVPLAAPALEFTLSMEEHETNGAALPPAAGSPSEKGIKFN